MHFCQVINDSINDNNANDNNNRNNQNNNDRSSYFPFKNKIFHDKVSDDNNIIFEKTTPSSNIFNNTQDNNNHPYPLPSPTPTNIPAHIFDNQNQFKDMYANPNDVKY